MPSYLNRIQELLNYNNTLYPFKDFINYQIWLFTLSNFIRFKMKWKLNKSFFVQEFQFRLRLIIAGIAISVNLTPNLINCLLTHPKPFGNFPPLQYSHAIKLPKEEEEEEEEEKKPSSSDTINQKCEAHKCEKLRKLTGGIANE